MIRFYIHGQKLTVKQPIIASETLDYLEADFVFSDDWKNTEKTAHFKQGTTTYDIILSDDKIVKNDHLALNTGEWEVSIHGNRYSDGEVIERITTTITNITVERTGILHGEAFPQLEPSIGEQILARVETKVNKPSSDGEANDVLTNDGHGGTIWSKSGFVEIYNSSTGKSKYSLEELAQYHGTNTPMLYRGYPLTIFTASTLLFRAYYINPVNHTVKKFDVKPDKSFFWYADVVLADNSALQNEATQRQANDNALSSRIDAVIARSDVVDVVGTYADLEEYDTDTLGDNDLIKVLKDETRDNTRTYYRWHTATNDFTFVGLEETSKIVEIAESTGQAALYTSNELYEMKLEGKIFSYRGIILSDVQAGRYSFNASYTEVMSGKVIVVSQVGNNLPIFLTTEVVGVNPQGGGTDYGIMFYLGNDGKLYFERNDL